MTIDTQAAISGFIATEPRLTYTEDGVPRFYARIGIEHSRLEPDGSFTQLEPTFHDMTMFRRAAEESVGRFHKGDKFVAAGRVHEYAYTKDGQTIQTEEFIASRIGHDTARTRYQVDRTPRQHAMAHQAPARDARTLQPQERSMTAQPASALGM
jgi:single-stranded DNA-binding protein